MKSCMQLMPESSPTHRRPAPLSAQQSLNHFHSAPLATSARVEAHLYSGCVYYKPPPPPPHTHTSLESLGQPTDMGHCLPCPTCIAAVCTVGPSSSTHQH
jgi:hypothetical protein